LGGECVFASEIDKYAIDTYQKNYGIDSNHNIREIDYENNRLPDHDVLCAGFPCQTFSKAGKQEGFNDETKGTLFFEIERILKNHHTKYIILENVRNLASHNHGNTWDTIYRHLKALGYRLTPKPIILSPHQIGVPQLRERVVILGVYDPQKVNEDLMISFSDFNINKDQNTIDTILEDEPVEKKYYITEYETMVLNAWDEFYKGISESVIGYPIWTSFFKKAAEESMPLWKKNFIQKNNHLYSNNKEFIDAWLKKYNNLKDFIPTHRKFEWQAGTSIDTLWEGIIQFRPSGIRVKKPTCFPALVAMVQIPIIGKRKRRLTITEAARLQSFENLIPNKNDQQAYKQFGNAVNVEVIRLVAEKLFKIQ
ncbi:MAG: DNA cytosine methyltransferase, partial [Erysipelotrichaceae bacterium]|nr:DNA cytosine methyltransferase [Erysipelotrichaceae bacterium]